MIIVSSPSKPVEYTTKGFPRRGATLKQYDEEIKDLYERIESVQGGNVLLSSTWTPEENIRFTREVVHSIMKHKVTDDEDLFQSGCDRYVLARFKMKDLLIGVSLQATWIRIKILRALREVDSKATRNLDPNFVFHEPSITRLANLIYNTIHPSASPVKTGDSRVKKLLSTIEKHTASFSSRPKDLIDRHEDGDVILLTGTTGGLGCNILAHLSLDPSVKKVYALNRSSGSGSLIKRQVDAMDKQGLLEECLRSPKFNLLEGDLSRPAFGLNPEVFETVRNLFLMPFSNVDPGYRFVPQLPMSFTMVCCVLCSYIFWTLTSSGISLACRLQLVNFLIRKKLAGSEKFGRSSPLIPLPNSTVRPLRLFYWDLWR